MRNGHTPTRRLALSYLAIIMTMSLLFSGIIFYVTSSQLNRPIPPPHATSSGFSQQDLPQGARDRIAERDHETRQSIVISLIVLNTGVLFLGSGFSYYLARRTLSPIEAAMESQSQFISDASHELRTPLTALLTTNEVALRKPHIDDAKARSVLSKNVSEVEKLHQLTETLLTLTQADRRDFQAEPLQLDNFVREVISDVRALAEAKQISLKLAVEPTQIAADKVALRQVLTILLDNAIKYSPSGSTVAVRSHETKNEVTLRIADQGIGIEAADQAHIFDRFYRADAARTRTSASGYGLGLAIAKSLCTRQGFVLELADSSPHGSTFAVRIPLS